MQVLLLPFGLAVLRIAEAYKSYVKRPYGSSITQAADVRLGLTMATWNILGRPHWTAVGSHAR